MERRRVLVTGGGGMLGRMLVPRLRDLGHGLTIMDNGGAWRESVRCDIRDPGQVRRVVGRCRPDILIHLAGVTGNLECETDARGAVLANAVGTYNVLRANEKARARVIFASTREVYGDTPETVGESARLDPHNMNGITKAFGEGLIRDFHDKSGMPFAILRFSNFLGESNGTKGISAMLRGAIQKNRAVVFGGAQEIDPLHYDDAVEAVLRSMGSKRSDTFNIASGRPVKVGDIVGRLEGVLGRRVEVSRRPRRAFESAHCRLDTGKAKRLLGFRPTISLDAMLSRMASRWAA